ncbi:MAG: helix-turn-helix transcriptional regulator [Clostridia bacterium]|nr:helix-turn-helix transcriptional regulator [Clostridia bacterium]
MKEKKYYKRLRELREDNDYTQETIGKLLGISQRGYAHYENGDYDIMGEFLIKLSNFYNTSTDYILELTDSPVPYKKIKNNKDLLKL